MPSSFQTLLATDNELIENLFQACLFPKNWQALVDTIVHTRPRSGAALVWRPRGSGDIEIVSAGLSPKAQATLRKRMASGTVDNASGPGLGGAQFTLDVGGAVPALLFVASRSAGATKLTDLHKELAARQKELRRAFALLTCHSEQRRALDRLDRLLEARAAPTLIVNGAGQMLAANALAERAIADARLLDLGREGTLRLRAADGAREPLSRSLSAIQRPALVDGGAASSRSENGAQEVLVIIPLPVGREPSIGSSKEFVLIVRKLFPTLSISSGDLQASFGFTQAEARLVAALASGLAIGRYARESRIKESTARWHLRNALDKTGCRTQTDLIRLALFLESW